MTDVALPTRKRGESLIFTATLEITADRAGVPTVITDLTGWDPICQFSRAPGGDERVTLELVDVTGQDVTFGITNAAAADMSGDYVGEIDLIDPDAPTGFGAITWPGAGSYLTLTMAEDVAVREPAP